MIVLNHNNRHFAFILSSFLAALSTAGILMYDDYLDYLIDKKTKLNEPLKIKIAYDICQFILKNIDCFDITKEETQLKLKEKVKVITARHKKLVSKVIDFSNDMQHTLTDQWRDFEEFIGHINLNE